MHAAIAPETNPAVMRASEGRLVSSGRRSWLGRAPVPAYPLRKGEQPTVSTTPDDINLLSSLYTPATERVTTGGCFCSDMSS